MIGEKIVSILLGIFGPSFVKQLLLRALVALQVKAKATSNTVDDLIVQALIDALTAEVDNDPDLPTTGAEVVQNEQKRLAGDPRAG